MEAGEDGFRGEIFRYEQVSVARLDREPVVFETLSVLARGKGACEAIVLPLVGPKRFSMAPSGARRGGQTVA
jgi:hypothetical protein